MIKKTLYALGFLLIASGVFLFLSYSESSENVSQIHQPETIIEQDIPSKEKVTEEKIEIVEKKKPTILIVPGHTAASVGTQHLGVSEYSLNYRVGKKLQAALVDYDVVFSHEGDGYSSEFVDVFIGEEEIMAFKKSKDDVFFTEKEPEVKHNKASPRATIELWGINYWLANGGADLAIHIHFNDHPRTNLSGPGAYTGYALYVAEEVSPNHSVSYSLAQSLEQELAKITTKSDHPSEKSGIIPTNLIATGQSGSLDVPVVLAELGYIYEPQLSASNQIAQEKALQDYAEALSEGIDIYFSLEQ